jgi:hypothetical protein
LDELATDMDSGDIAIIDPRVYPAKHLKNDPDSPNMHQTMHGDFVEKYIDAMKYEIVAFIQQKTWTPIPQAEAIRVIKTTWVFKLKHFPNVTLLKFKAMLCVRDDLPKKRRGLLRDICPCGTMVYNPPAINSYFTRRIGNETSRLH